MTVSRKPEAGSFPAGMPPARIAGGAPAGLREEDVERDIASRFEAVALQHPSRIAVRDEGGALTYSELDGRANGIARAVLEAGGESGVPVALLLGREGCFPAAALGVFKAGRFFVSLDPVHPRERNAFILRDSGARLLLTDRSRLAQARELAARNRAVVELVDLDDAGRPAARAPERRVSPHDLCFVVYTSGSTGRPKGVCQQHRNILHGAGVYTRTAGLVCEDRLSLLSSSTSIAGATALFGGLLNGAAMHPFDVGRRGLDELARWVDRERITCLHAVPTLFRRFGSRLGPGVRFESVRLVRLGGEAVTRADWLLFRGHFPQTASLLSGLGSTETLDVRLKMHAWREDPGGAVLPAGDPVADIETEIVDERGVAVRDGVVGEVVVRSEFLFPGYWRRPGLTAAVLSPDPHDRRRKRYRTGDFARVAEGGRFFFVGRADSRVKICGHTVEAAEVENALKQLPGLADAAVVVERRGADAARLVAFVAPGDPAAPGLDAVRRGLCETLPAHMIPASILPVAELPLLPGGKIDRAGLAARVGAASRPPAGPRNPIEQTLAGIWQRVVGVAEIGIHEDLFSDLGGDSLHAAEILAEVSAVFRCDLPLSALYEGPTVATLGRRLLESGWTPPASGHLGVNPRGSRRPLFGVCGAFGHALRLLLVGRALGEEQPFYGLQPPGMDWASVGCGTIEEMAAHYLREMRRIQPRGPYRLLGTSFGGVVVFEIALQLQRAGEEVALLAMVDTTPPACAVPDGIDHAERRDWGAGIDTGERLASLGVRVAKAHRQALDRYVLRQAFEGTITFFRCAEAAVPPGRDRRPLWGRFASRGVRSVAVPGRHGHFHREPQFSAVVAGLRQALAASDEAGETPRGPRDADPYLGDPASQGC